MSFLGRNYVFVKQENFDGFLKFIGLPDEKIKKHLDLCPKQKIVKIGDSYTYISLTPDGPKETTFKSGVEFDDVMGSEKTRVRTTYTVDGNTVTQKVIGKPEQGVTTFLREYNGDDLVVTITSDKWGGVAKRFFKAE